ncbi:molybdenum cofactor biosynthesis protein MoaE [Sphingobacterium sp. SRCM116780]|uniref:molybdenum cofactor biosynthesis protein MoaE n=1 Tax=Sphingobacterium sp. SRCM116780 TaxID=2907623 RepID=UPI001F445B1D|nr:molybdenum cofactor biosynthesis protein MoaE [Sphingobacterium sp. SRCM116780]UIR56855.1 molybdenum cofactor biosynthesis protein MoaE [Sphingobacterium sp. SRCM116780]
MKNIFVDGAISPDQIAASISKHAQKTDIGAHALFLGQVRADEVDDRRVSAILYTAYEEMALEKMHTIREHVFAKYDLICMHVYHSLGEVQTGQLCLFVFVSSKHRRDAQEACKELVEQIKKELPIWGKELFEDNTHQWKKNN